MDIAARRASAADLEVLVALYRELEAEQTALRPMWRLADGLAEPVADTLEALVHTADHLIVGTIDGAVVGFLWATVDPLLPQAGGRRVGTIRLVSTEPAARGVGVGEAMMARALDDLRAEGIDLFDAKVSPGHREAKNFFESHGFSARLIVMHRAEAGRSAPGSGP